MLPNRNNPQRWFAWYPVFVDNGIFPRWLTEVWWYIEDDYHVDGRGVYTVHLNRYRKIVHGENTK